jgi:hypothetical protein
MPRSRALRRRHTLDRYIADSDDNIDWLTQYDGGEPDADPMDGYDAFYEDVGALVSGSVTYDWIRQRERMAVPGQAVLGADVARPTPRRGSGRALQRLARGDDRVGGRREAVDRRRRRVASQFAEAGLLDQVRVTVVPVVLGAGKPLFERRLPGPRCAWPVSCPVPAGWLSCGTSA